MFQCITMTRPLFETFDTFATMGLESAEELAEQSEDFIVTVDEVRTARDRLLRAKVDDNGGPVVHLCIDPMNASVLSMCFVVEAEDNDAVSGSDYEQIVAILQLAIEPGS